MDRTYISALLVCVCLVGLGTCDDQKYNSKFDKISVDDVLKNTRLFNNYVKCFLDEGPCTGEGKEMKEILPEALQTGCSKCTEIQKASVAKVLSYLLQEKRDIWIKLTAKYDPDGTIQKAHGIDQDDDDDDDEEETAEDKDTTN